MRDGILDCRGLACPQPVIETKKILEAGTEKPILVIVDNAAARENVARFVKNAGCAVGVEEKEGCYYLTVTKPDAAAPARSSDAEGGPSCETAPGAVYLITTNSLGQGSPDLGEVLMKSLMVTLTQAPPAAVLLLNTGVHMAVAGSPVLEQLQKLAETGTEILVCGTCLNYYKLVEKLAVGAVSNMVEINSRLNGPYKAITIG